MLLPVHRVSTASSGISIDSFQLGRSEGIKSCSGLLMCLFFFAHVPSVIGNAGVSHKLYLGRFDISKCQRVPLF